MKQTYKLIVAASMVWSLQLAGSFAQTTTETTATLLSKIQREDSGNRLAGDTFQVSFGSLNGGRASLLSKGSESDGAAGFATWYGLNSRTFLTWTGGVVGADIVESDNFIRYYGPDTTAETRQGSALDSIYNSTLDNEALAFVTYSTGGAVAEVGLYSFNFDWAGGVSLGTESLFDIFTLSAGNVSAIYGGADAAANGGYGQLTTSSVPEPSSASLLLLGATALVALRRLRKNV